MLNKQLLMIMCIVLFGLSGCGGSDDGDDVTINQTVNQGSTDSGSGTDDSSDGDCSALVSADFVDFNSECTVATVTGTIDSDYTFISTVQYRLEGTVLVGNGNQEITAESDVQTIKNAGATLTIEAGTDIRAFDTGTLIVTRGSKIEAEGTATSPITFSSLDDNYEGTGEWGGVIIQGFAPQYGAGNTGACYGDNTYCNVQGEGGTDVAYYGGDDPADDSGTFKYVRIAEGGKIAGPNNEVNGLTLQGVGHATTVEYIHVHNNLDDGVEWFGGTVNAKYLVLTGNDDDDIDYDEGYQGNIQYAIVQKSENPEPQGSNDPRAIEANSSDDEYVPQTSAVIANVTIVGGAVNNAEAHSKGIQPGMRLRGAVKTDLFNTSVANFDYGCIRIDDADTDGAGTIVASVINATNILGDCVGGVYPKRSPDTELNASATNNAPLTYSATLAIQESAAQLSSAPTIVAVNNGSGFVFDETRFVGAVDPGAGTGWWEGWTIPGALDAGEEVVDESPAFVTCSDDVCTLEGTINQDYTLVRGVEWRLKGEVLVGSGNILIENQSDYDSVVAAGVTLTIRAGIHVKAFDDGSLLVTRGSKLNAVGTAASPITFSSVADTDFDGMGEWGGVILQGFAPQYGAGNTGACWTGSNVWCNVEGEGGTVVGRYGGNVPEDNSGSLKYVRIAEGGKIAGPNNEINGLTLQGVGYGTKLSYIQVHNNLDDGVEWFGGTASISHVVLTGNDDDDIDFDEGFKGNIQYAIIKKSDNAAPEGSNDPRGIEANSSDDEYAPQTEAVLANVHVQGGLVNNNADHSKGVQPGARLRGSVTVQIHNSVFTGWEDGGCIRIDDSDTDGDGTTDSNSNVTLQNTIGNCEPKGFYPKRSADAELGTVGANSDFTANASYAITGAPSITLGTAITPVSNGDTSFTFDQTDFIGAVDPATEAGSEWWSGWIIPNSLDQIGHLLEI